MAIDVVIVGAARTPVGSFSGALSSVPAHQLGATAIKAALSRANVDPADVDEVILGQVLSANTGQNAARQAAMAAGIPQEATAWGLNQLCGSGLRAVALGLQQIANGDAEDHRRRRPWRACRSGPPTSPICATATHKMGSLELHRQHVEATALTDAFHGYHMGVTAENVAEQWGLISREEQDAFAVASQNKAEAAQKSGRFKPTRSCPVDDQVDRKGDVDRRSGRISSVTASTARGDRPSCVRPSTRPAR